MIPNFGLIMLCATVAIGVGLVGATDYSVAVRTLLNMVFLAQFLLSLWVTVIVFRDNKK